MLTIAPLNPLRISLELYYMFILFCYLNANGINEFYMLLKLPLYLILFCKSF